MSYSPTERRDAWRSTPVSRTDVSRARVLLVEDEPGLQLAITDRLAAEGYVVETAADGDTAVLRARSEAFDLIVLDVMLPGRDGFDVARTLRHGGITAPILMLTARSEVVDRVVGLKLGADDYVTKPFEMIELTARIEALLRRVPVTSAPGLERYRFGDITVDIRRAEVTREGQPVELSAKEFQLLRYFIEHRGATLSRDELLHEVWGYNAMPSTRTVDVHVAWLRQKLEPNPRIPQFILTMHGLGYKFKES
jgi:two-component system, OmpR family, alkaline phosphatase synthesis response regulator PhoP